MRLRRGAPSTLCEARRIHDRNQAASWDGAPRGWSGSGFAARCMRGSDDSASDSAGEETAAEETTAEDTGSDEEEEAAADDGDDAMGGACDAYADYMEQRRRHGECLHSILPPSSNCSKSPGQSSKSAPASTLCTRQATSSKRSFRRVSRAATLRHRPDSAARSAGQARR